MAEIFNTHTFSTNVSKLITSSNNNIKKKDTDSSVRLSCIMDSISNLSDSIKALSTKINVCNSRIESVFDDLEKNQFTDITINKKAHNFSIGEMVSFSKETNTYVKADALINTNFIGIVESIIDVNNVVVKTYGIHKHMSNLMPGKLYYVSEKHPGKLTTIVPSLYESITTPVLLALSSSSGIINFKLNQPYNMSNVVKINITVSDQYFEKYDIVAFDQNIGYVKASVHSDNIIGIVVNITEHNATIVQFGTVTLKDLNVEPGKTYYLSDVPGKFSNKQPITTSNYSVSLFTVLYTDDANNTATIFVKNVNEIEKTSHSITSKFNYDKTQTFSIGDVLMIDTDNSLKKVVANHTIPTERIIGIVSNISESIIEITHYGKVCGLKDLIPGSIYCISDNIKSQSLVEFSLCINYDCRIPVFVANSQTSGFYSLGQKINNCNQASKTRIRQKNHNFKVGNIISINQNNDYVLASAKQCLNIIGIVSKVINSDEFIVTHSGLVKNIDLNANPGTIFYLSQIVPGALTSNINHIENSYILPLLVTSSSDEGYFNLCQPCYNNKTNQNIILTKQPHKFKIGNVLKKNDSELGFSLVTSLDNHDDVVCIVTNVISDFVFEIGFCGKVSGFELTEKPTSGTKIYIDINGTLTLEKSAFHVIVYDKYYDNIHHGFIKI